MSDENLWTGFNAYWDGNGAGIGKADKYHISDRINRIQGFAGIHVHF